MKHLLTIVAFFGGAFYGLYALLLTVFQWLEGLQTNKALTETNQALAQALTTQADALADLIQAQAQHQRAEGWLYLAAGAAVVILAAAVFVLALAVFRTTKAQPHQVIYLPQQEYFQRLDPGQSLIIVPDQVKVRDYVRQ